MHVFFETSLLEQEILLTTERLILQSIHGAIHVYRHATAFLHENPSVVG